MNDLASVCIGDYYTPQPKQHPSVGTGSGEGLEEGPEK
jgi:hypothetical protein